MKSNKSKYELDYTDETFVECIICSVVLKKESDGTYSLSAGQQAKIERALAGESSESSETEASLSDKEESEEEVDASETNTQAIRKSTKAGSAIFWSFLITSSAYF